MNDLICPHCRQQVPHGAKVCRGCQAEIEYGTPPAMYFLVLILSIIMGFWFAKILPVNLYFLAWGGGIAILFFLNMLIRKMFKDRVEFKRIYHTK